MPIVRTIDAAVGETIEIHWWRRRPYTAAEQGILGSPDPQKKDLTEILIDRHTAPPASVWEARALPHKEPETHD
jgi:hypothetical protein